MERLEYEVKISAPARVVWETMLQKETYEQWTAKSWPNSSYEGKWEKGTEIKFGSTKEGGTLAKLEDVKPYEHILAKHIAILIPGGGEDRTSDDAKGWVGTLEEYKFTERNGETTLKIVMQVVDPKWKKMLDDGWPTALEELKKLSEKQLSEV
jgi:uncharacterized protein YndB with AHSA1/START domain